MATDRVTSMLGECWMWPRAKNSKGYGVIKNGCQQYARQQYAHRVVYSALRGPIPDGLVIDHLCRVRSCMNPYHMEVVTVVENIMRGMSITAINARKVDCYKCGNPLEVIGSSRDRRCRPCLKIRNRKDWIARKARLASKKAGLNV